MSFGESIVNVFNHYADANGKASRSEYWWWTLFVFILSFCAGFIEGLIGMDASVISGLLSLGLLCPNICVAIRRCHDSGHSGWWVLCPIVNFVMMLLPSED